MNIREIRKQRGLTLTEAAEQMQRSAAWLSRIERGAMNKISRDDLSILSRWVGQAVSADAMLALTDEHPVNGTPQ